MQHARKSPSRAASARDARPNVKFRWELLGDIQEGVTRLLETHWSETDVNHDDVPLDPNWPQYAYLEKIGWLFCASARVDGRLVGYTTVFVNLHIHHKNTKYATVDVMYIHPDYRSGWTGVRFVRFLEKGARHLGAKVMRFDVKEHFKNKRGHGVGDVLRFLGFDAVDVSYMKVLK